MADTKKVSMIAKDLKITSKELIENLKEHGIELKSATSVITDEQIAIAFDIFTSKNTMSEDEIKAAKEAAIKAKAEAEAKAIAEAKAKKEQEEAEELAKRAKKPEPPAEPVIIKKAEPKIVKKAEPKPEKKAEVEKKSEPKTVKKAAEKAEPKKTESKNVAVSKNEKKKHHNQAKKQSGQKVDLSAIAHDDSETIVVQTKEKHRYVDTRTANVDLDTLASNERLESFEDDSRTGNRNKKEKNNKKNNRQQENNRFDKKNNKKNNKAKQPIPKKVITEVEIPELITVSDFAAKIGKPGAEIVKKLFMLGTMATMNQAIDFETAELIGADFGIEVKQEVVVTKEEMLFAESEAEDNEEDLIERPPVVVVMGHVDHGKTSLLDAIRDTDVTSTEAGGITQHIGAYNVTLNDRVITFLDTPGHEAFTTMRARGAMVTDIAILVVAADDGIMPQTIEAINHAKAAGVQIIVAVNKIDKEGANPTMVKQALTEHELIPEEWGGDTIVVEVSAKQRINIDGLLEMVLLVADMQELKANPNRSAVGTVVEARVDKGKGPVATVLVQNGTLNIGDIVIAGTAVGRVRAMVNDKGRRVKSAGPSMPVEIQGLSEAPTGGDRIVVVSNEKLARDVAEQRRQEMMEDKFNAVTKVSLDNLFSQIDEGKMKELDVIIKADVQGSVEAVKQSLEKLSNDEVRVRAIHGGVGAINESDVMLADASNAIIVGFNVRPDAGAVSMSAQKDVDIRLYRVIYQAIEEIEAAMKGMLDPEFKEVVLGYADVRQVIRIPSVGNIAGCYVTQGKIVRNAEIRLVREGIIVHEGKIDSLKRFKDDAKEVNENFECGLGIENFNDIKEGDRIECFIMEEVAR